MFWCKIGLRYLADEVVGYELVFAGVVLIFLGVNGTRLGGQEFISAQVLVYKLV